MKSVTAKILLWCLGVLVFSWIAFLLVSRAIAREVLVAETTSSETTRRQLEAALRAYDAGGAAKLTANLATIRRTVFGKFHVLDSRGRDLVTGADRAALIAGMQHGESRVTADGGVLYYAGSADGHTLVWISDWVNAGAGMELKDFLPYYLLILAAVAALFWMLARNIAIPIRQLAVTVNRFGGGDLVVRVNSSRQDEIGGLSRDFDRMAERIATLLTAERRLLQDVSHELRSPLARLSFAAELTRTAEDRDAAAARLKKEIARLADLVGALLQVTRAEGDPSLRRWEDVRLDELAREVAADCGTPPCGVTVDAAKPIAIRGDRELLRRAIENIAQNAIRHSRSEPVHISVSSDKNAARLSVRDDGPGVPEDALLKIFQPFFRVDESRDHSTGGMGLGLAIAHRTVTLHHGRLWAENTAPGLRVTMELQTASLVPEERQQDDDGERHPKQPK